MAARRLAKSAVDWGAFAERVPKNQVDLFRAFKAKSDNFVSQIHRYPEALPAIDFAMYRSKLASPALVDQFEKAYGSVTVPYPKDNGNTLAKIEAQEKEAATQTAEFVKSVTAAMKDAQSLVDKVDSLPPVEDMTHEMFYEYFPSAGLDPVNRPTFWPHVPSAQPGYDPEHEIK